MNLSPDVMQFKRLEDMTDLQECIGDITKDITLLREEVKDHMNSHHIQLKSVMSNNTNIHVQAEKLLENIKDLQLRLDTQMKREVNTLTEELKTMKDSLDESTMLVEQVNKLLVIDTEINTVRTKKEQHSYLEIMKHLDTAQKYLQEECTDLEYLDIYKVISETIILWYSDYYKEVSKLWEEMINITCLEVEGKKKTAFLNVSIRNVKMSDILMTLSLLGELSHRISLFANTFYEEILVPIIEKNATAVSELKSDAVVLIILSDLKELTGKKPPPDYEHILKNLSTVFNYLYANLNYETEEGTLFIKELGDYIGENFAKLLDETCLTHTIPRKREDLGNFIKVVGEILTLDKLLKKMQFLDVSNETLKRYGGSVEELYLNKTIETYLSTAREIMKKDIQDMKQVEPMEIKDDEFISSNKSTSVVMDQISLGLFQFPKCCISKSAEELILLVNEILKEIVTDRQANTDFALKMFGTAKDLFMVYRFASVYHKKKIESIPQQAALLHNNLIYLAHEAMGLQLDYRSKFPPCLVQNMAHFVDLVIPLRTLAAEVLDQQVSKQQVIITDIIKKAGLTSLSDFDNLSDNTRKHLKQCLCQLSFLKNIWYKVLPGNVYCRIMGQLSFLFAEEIIAKVLSTKDLTADTTLELATIFGSIQEDIPTLFPEPKEIHRYVKNWTKFKELVHILKGNLAEIEERWADGKGPLANEFTPIQLKHLIKALFQNSDRRAAVLASIN